MMTSFFQDDNASFFTEKGIKAFFSKKSMQKSLRWEAKSPDINTIEDLWRTFLNAPGIGFNSHKITINFDSGKLEGLWWVIFHTINEIHAWKN